MSKSGGYAFFRIPSFEYEKDEDFLVTAKQSRTRMELRIKYNNQILTLTITRKPTLIAAFLNKTGIRKKSIPLIPDKT